MARYPELAAVLGHLSVLCSREGLGEEVVVPPELSLSPAEKLGCAQRRDQQIPDGLRALVPYGIGQLLASPDGAPRRRGDGSEGATIDRRIVVFLVPTDRGEHLPEFVPASVRKRLRQLAEQVGLGLGAP